MKERNSNGSALLLNAGNKAFNTCTGQTHKIKSQVTRRVIHVLFCDSLF
jgi:hypothetical protein